MNASTERRMEDAADAEAALDETCRDCGTLLRDHYTSRGTWRQCRVADLRRSGTPFCRDCGEPNETTGHMGCQYPQNHA